MSEPQKQVELPGWAEWLDGRHVALRCKACRCVYTEPYKGFDGVMYGGFPVECKVCEDAAAEVARKSLELDRSLVGAVREYALEHYDRDGWDYVVETYGDQEIWEVIAGCANAAAAIAKMKEVTTLLDERRDDVQSTAW